MQVICPVCEGGGVLETLTTPDVMRLGAKIVEEVADNFRMSAAELTGPSRRRRIVEARRQAVIRLREETNLTLYAIGLLIGRRHHSTVMHMLKASR